MLSPIGALTSKPYAFVSRPWEINSSESVDFFDSFLSNIRIDERGLKIIRILPVSNSSNNEFWISDRIRFCYSSQSNQLLLDNFIFYDDLVLRTSTQNISMLFYLSFSKINSITFEFGTPTSLEFQFFFSTFCNFFNKFFFNANFIDHKAGFTDFRCFYSSHNIKNFFSGSYKDAFFIFNINTRFSFPVFNSFAKSIFSNSNLPVFYFGSSYNSNFSSYLNIGSTVTPFLNFISFKSRLNKFFFDSSFNSNIFFPSKDYIYFNSSLSKFFNIFPITSNVSSIISSELNVDSFNFRNTSSFNDDFNFVSYNSSFEYDFNKICPKFNVSIESNFDFSSFNFQAFCDFSKPDFIVSFPNIFSFSNTFISIDGFSKSSSNFKKLPHISSFLFSLFSNFFPFINNQVFFYDYFFRHVGIFYSVDSKFPIFNIPSNNYKIFDSYYNFFSDSIFSFESARSHYLRSPYSRYSTPLVLQYARFKSSVFNHNFLHF